jgi:hypothetical protein
VSGVDGVILSLCYLFNEMVHICQVGLVLLRALQWRLQFDFTVESF